MSFIYNKFKLEHYLVLLKELSVLYNCLALIT